MGTVAKLLISFLALYFVFRSIDTEKLWSILMSINVWPLIPATLLFIISKVVSAFRLAHFFAATGLLLHQKYNLRLYWIGMFYNLFLPGGIGGDGYKVYLLHREFKHPMKPLIGATLLDRLTGMVTLVFLAMLGVCWLIFTRQFVQLQQEWGWLPLVGSVISYPVFYGFVYLLFRPYVYKFGITNIQSGVVQVSQLGCAHCILLALEVHSDILAYQVVFLVSSLVAILPFTVGGIGARELTFILANQYIGINEEKAIAFSLIFFLITALASMGGGFLSARPKSN